MPSTPTAAHPVVQTFAAFYDGCAAVAARFPTALFRVVLTAQGATVQGLGPAGLWHMPAAMDWFTAHQRVGLQSDALALAGLANAWRAECDAVPSLSPLVGSGMALFTQGGAPLFDWESAAFHADRPNFQAFPRTPADRQALLDALERAIEADHKAAGSPLRPVSLFNKEGVHLATVPSHLPVVQALLPFCFPSTAAERGTGTQAFLALPEGRFSFFDVEEDARAISATSNTEAVVAFWSAVRALNARLCVPISPTIHGLTFLVDKSRPRVSTLNGPYPAFGPQGPHTPAPAPWDVFFPEIESLWAKAVALLPADGQWRHTGIRATLYCTEQDGARIPPPITSANLALRGRNGWGNHSATLRTLCVSSTGNPYRVALDRRAETVIVHAATPRAAAAVAIAAYSGTKGPRAYNWPFPVEVWSLPEA